MKFSLIFLSLHIFQSGDSSLLLKYLNPNVVLVVSTSVKGASSSSTVTVAESTEDSVDSHSSSDAESSLHVNLIDTVTGRVVYHLIIPNGAVGVHGRSLVNAEIIENSIIVTYWNIKAQRMELSSLTLFEGMINKNGLGPVNSLQAPKFVNITSFGAPAPIGIQKTYILPKSVEILTHTRTKKGIANKHLLLGLTNGQVFSMDLRVIDPRRPMGVPTPSEKEEGLMQYNPYLQFIPHSAVTYNYTVPRLRGIVASPSQSLESTSLILAFGLDVQFSRVTPSNGFDMLSSNFNREMLTLIMVVLFIIVVVLRSMMRKKSLDAAWA